MPVVKHRRKTAQTVIGHGGMRFVGCASYTPKTKDWRMMKDGNDLRVLKIFDDGDPLTYCWRISKGVFQTDPPFTDFPWEKLPS